MKHYALNSQELNRFGVNMEVDERTLREIYLPAFEAAVKEAGCLTVMGAYNQVRGEYCSQNDELNNKILKGEWGFKGFVVTDWGGLRDTEKGALGGLDVEMNSGANIRYFKAPLLEAVRSGKIPESVINDKAMRVLYVMAKIKKISNGKSGEERANGARNTREHHEFARKVAEESIVLLKNDRELLPLERGALKTLLVIGDNATRKHATGGGSSSGKPPYEITPLEGLKKLLGESVQIDYIPSRFSDKFSAIPEKCIETANANSAQAGLVIKGWKAQYYHTPEPQDAPTVTSFDQNITLRDSPALKALGTDRFFVRWTATIKPDETGGHIFQVRHNGRVRVLVDGNTVIDDQSIGKVRSSLSQPVYFEKETTCKVTVEYSHTEGAAEAGLAWRPPSAHAMGTDELANRAKTADMVLFFTGNQHDSGGERDRECEGRDRVNIKLPEGDDEAIATVLAANPKTVVINLSGSPVEMPWIAQAHTLLQYWFSGMEGGNALARILFGEINPSGKLPFTFPRRLEDSPAHALDDYNPQKVLYKEGVLVGYRWYDTRQIEPLFPFGYGLSYTRFKYSGLKLVEKKGEPQVTVRFEIENTGKREGAEVAQVYLHQEQPDVLRPDKELKGFQKVVLRPGEKKEVHIPLDCKAFAYYAPEQKGWIQKVVKKRWASRRKHG